MAGGFAKFTDDDTPGVCLATSGPGAIHLLTGSTTPRWTTSRWCHLRQTRMSSVPPINEVDLLSSGDVSAISCKWPWCPSRSGISSTGRCVLRCRSEPLPAIIPDDVQALDAIESPPREHGAVFSGTSFTRHRPVPSPEDLAKAADILNAGERVAMLVGAGALGATDELIQVADRLGAGVAKALLGKAAVPDEYPFVTGSIGLGTAPSWRLMMECDTLLMVGSSFPYAEFLPSEGQARGVQIDIDPLLLSIRYLMELALVGDARATLSAFIPLLEGPRGSLVARGHKLTPCQWELIENKATQDGEPLTPQRPFWELNQRLPDESIITADSGTAASWYARHIRMRRGMMGSLRGISPAWGRVCPTPSLRNSPIPTARPSPSSGTGRCRCWDSTS